MSEILARIRVREIHGIRRFLYPLATMKRLPEGIEIAHLALKTLEGQSIPLQISPERNHGSQNPFYVLNFAVSLEPFSVLDLLLVSNEKPSLVNDPLQVEFDAKTMSLHNRQERLLIDIDKNANITNVVYDQISSLKGPIIVTRNGQTMNLENSHNLYGPNLLEAWVRAEGRYKDESYAETTVQITACKSWATISHWMLWPQEQDTFVFTLPFAITCPILTCDFGVGGGIYGKLQKETAEEIVWQIDFKKEAYAQWSVSTNGRVDYKGTISSFAELLPQLWFHLIDSDKALAVAITGIGARTETMTVSLRQTGEVTITFKQGNYTKDNVFYSVCYHFLNDVPAIAAATNPQSILLPPVVEVLPV